MDFTMLAHLRYAIFTLLISLNSLILIISPSLSHCQTGINEWISIANDDLYTGMIRAIAIHPRNSLIIYIGLKGGGIYKSEDGGLSWAAKNTNLTNKNVLTIEIDSTDTNILYAGTENGAFKSLDDGESWQSIGLTNCQVNDIAIDPDSPKIIYAATGKYRGEGSSIQGFWKSKDSGLTWMNRVLKNCRVYSIEIGMASYNAKRIFVGTNQGIWMSDDDGETFPAGYNNLTHNNVYQIIVYPHKKRWVYAGTGNFSGHSQGVWYSDDRGDTWYWGKKHLENFTITALSVNSSMIYAATSTHEIYRKRVQPWAVEWEKIASPATAIFALEANATNDSILHLGSADGFYTSRNRGQSWQNSSTGIIHPIVHEISFDPKNPENFYLATQGTGYFSPDKGQSWSRMNGLPNNGIYSFVINPHNSSQIFAGTKSNGIYRSDDAGKNWWKLRLYGPGSDTLSVYSIAIDPTPANQATLFIGTCEGIYKSINNGNSWSHVLKTNYCIKSLLISPIDQKSILAGTHGGGVYQSTDGGSSWHKQNEGFTQSIIHTIVVDPMDAHTIYLGTENGIFIRDTDDSAWRYLSDPILRNRYIRDICIDPSGSGIIYAATYRSGILRSLDNGSSWHQLDGNPGKMNNLSLSLFSNNTHELYLGTEGNGLLVFTAMPELSITPESIDFGEIRVLSNAIEPISITNTGELPVKIRKFIVSNNVFKINNTVRTLGVNQTINIQLGFVPDTMSEFSNQTLTLQTNFEDLDPRISLRGVGVAPKITFSTRAHDFGQVRIQHPDTLSLMLKNTGNDTLFFETTLFESVDEFQIHPSNSMLQSQDSIAINIIFTPRTKKLYQNMLRLASNHHSFFYGDSLLILVGQGVIGPIMVGIDSAYDLGRSIIGKPISCIFGIKNSGDQALKINNIQLVNGERFHITATPRIIMPNNPNDSLLVTITFNSTDPGIYYDSLKISNNSIDGDKQIGLKAECLSCPLISLSKNEINFGGIRINETVSKELFILNPGSDSLFISEINWHDKKLINLVETSNRIAPEESIKITINYTPKDSSVLTDTIIINSNALDGTRRLLLQGKGIAPFIQFYETEYDFDSVAIRKSKEWQLTISNIGDDTLNFTNGFEKLDNIFSVMPSFGSINPNSTMSIKIGFRPENDTLYQNQLRIVSKNHRFFYGDSILYLIGHGYIPPISTPDSLEFGDVLVHTTRQHLFSLENHGLDTFYFSTDIINDPQRVFSKNNSTTFIPPLQKKPIFVYFTPIDTINYNADFVIKSESLQEGEIIIPLSGNGINDAIMSLDHEQYNFGKIRLGSSAEMQFQIKNTGNRRLNILGFQWEPFSDSTVFRIAIDDTLLEENDSTRMIITFETNQMKLYQGILHIWSTTKFGTHSIQLSGMGVAPLITVPDTINGFGKVAVSETRTSNCVIQNNGTDSLYITNIEVMKYPNIFLLDKEQARVALGDSTFLTIAFQPKAVSSYCDSIRIISDALNYPISYIRLTGKGVDLNGPSIMHTPFEIATQDESISLSMNISDSLSGVQAAMIYYRTGGTSQYLSGILQNQPEVDSSNYYFTISGNMLTSRGIDYYLMALDSVSNETRIPKHGHYSIRVQVTEQGEFKIDSLGLPCPQPFGSAQTAYRMISIPFELANPNPRDVLVDDLGSYDPSKWILADYRFPGKPYPDCYVYFDHDSISNFVPGKAFFLLVNEEGNVIDSGPGSSIRTDQPFKIQLVPGWNIIGNPFNFPIPIQSISFMSEQLCNLFSYDGQWTDILTHPITSMLPWGGYAIYNSLAEIDSLVINPDLNSDSLNIDRTFLDKHLDESIWRLHITARCQATQDGFNYVGLSESASVKFDTMDQPEPPAVGEFVMLTFPHNDWGDKSACYTTDFQSFNEDGNVWEFMVITSLSNSLVKLEFHAEEIFSENDDLILIDRDLQMAQNLLVQKEYSFISETAFKSKTFRLIAGSDSFVEENSCGINILPEKFELFQNFPNPFNSATSIKYTLPKTSTVQLAVYNLSGEIVRTLVDQPSQAQGYYLAIWDGLDNNDNPVASGIYFVYLKTPEFRTTKKLILIK